MQAPGLRFANDDDMPEKALPAQRWSNFAKDCRVNYEYSSLTFAEEVVVIGCSCKRNRRHGHSADFHHAEICNGELGGVGQN